MLLVPKFDNQTILDLSSFVSPLKVFPLAEGVVGRALLADVAAHRALGVHVKRVLLAFTAFSPS